VRLADDAERPPQLEPATPGRAVRPSTIALIGVVALVVAGIVAVASWVAMRRPTPSAAAPIAITPGATATSPDPGPATPTSPTVPTVSTPTPGSRPAAAVPDNGPTDGHPQTLPSSAPPPTGTSTPSSDVTFTAAGGQVIAACQGDLAYLVSWTPTTPYRVDSTDQGPATNASATFRHGIHLSTVTVSCATGEPVATISDT
jgi:hypothetical protein